jgi:hypothetical protein
MTPEMLVADGAADKWLVDPPREGAFALAKALADIEQARIGAEGAGPLPAGAEGWTPPKRIVYVSCNPATLARDAGLLVHLAGYRCTAARGMVNMFPHTAHVESMAVFERCQPGVAPDERQDRKLNGLQRQRVHAFGKDAEDLQGGPARVVADQGFQKAAVDGRQRG